MTTKGRTNTKTQRTCLGCKTEFMSGKCNGNYCSHKCRRYRVKKSCKVCGTQFEGFSQTLTCSATCKAKCRIRFPERHGIKTCEVCSVSFVPKTTRWTRTCGRTCGATLRLREGTHGRTITGREKELISIRKAVSAIKRINKRYQGVIEPCGVCRKLKGWRTIGFFKRWNPCTIYCKTCKPLMRMISHGISDVRTRVCCMCFKPRTNDHLKTDAGMRCVACEAKVRAIRRSQSKQLRRAQSKANGPYDKDISLWAVSSRDSDTCHICRAKVDWKDKTIGNMYPSVDHVVPLSKGGTHTWDNVKIAHRWCNSVKCDKIGDMGDIVVLG